jgi:hypothetical protein
MGTKRHLVMKVITNKAWKERDKKFAVIFISLKGTQNRTRSSIQIVNK